MRKLPCWLPFLVLALALSGCEETTPAPAAAGKPHSATLTWDASTSRVRGYHVYRATDPEASPGLLAVTPADVTQYVDNSVEPGRTYYYSVKSVGPDGTEGGFSERVSATIPTD